MPPWSHTLSAALAARHRTLRATVSACINALAPGEQAALRGVLVWLTLAIEHSRRTTQALPQPYTARRLDGLRDAWRAWRSARAAAAGRLCMAKEHTT